MASNESDSGGTMLGAGVDLSLPSLSEVEVVVVPVLELVEDVVDV
jgi:hypothetical protein